MLVKDVISYQNKNQIKKMWMSWEVSQVVTILATGYLKILYVHNKLLL
jgi:hypothetical protein